MGILVSPLAVANAQPYSKVSTPYSAGNVSINVVFPMKMANTSYTPTFSIGSNLAIPAVTVTNKTVTGYTFSFIAAAAGTIVAAVVP